MLTGARALAKNIKNEHRDEIQKENCSGYGVNSKKKIVANFDYRCLLTPLIGPVLARVEYDYEAKESGELSLEVGRVVTILDSSDPAWWTGDLNGKVGTFPSNVRTVLSPHYPLACVINACLLPSRCVTHWRFNGYLETTDSLPDYITNMIDPPSPFFLCPQLSIL